MKFETLEWEIRDSIAYLRINTPPKNTMTLKFYDEFTAIVKLIQHSYQSSLKGLIISGKGRHFSSGADIDQLFSLFARSNTKIPKEIERNGNSFRALAEFEFPVVSIIQGVCIGSAFELALCSHFRFSAPNALLGLPESSFGLMPGLGGIYNMKMCTGKAKTMELILSGELLSAVEAFEYSLIDMVVEKNQLIKSGVDLINSIPDNYKRVFKRKYLRYFSDICQS